MARCNVRLVVISHQAVFHGEKKIMFMNGSGTTYLVIFDAWPDDSDPVCLDVSNEKMRHRDRLEQNENLSQQLLRYSVQTIHTRVVCTAIYDRDHLRVRMGTVEGGWSNVGTVAWGSGRGAVA